ncbi:lipoprotein [Spiroplasma endosymbiont of Polydrusus formosus]|uniref:lipoprotein n=1 Tax=Spiroplasma endosymbiont of Polydrusus formosus TaxID=3139326 RepID=UPI0035B52686
MKKILSLLGIIALIGTSTTNLVACNTPQKQEYSPKELKELKEKNKISTKDGILEWIAPQEKHFSTADNNYYFVVWRGTINDNWIIKLFQNISFSERRKVLDTQEDYELALTRVGDNLFRVKTRAVRPVSSWSQDDRTYFKSVYFWNKNINIPNLIVDYKTGEIKVKEINIKTHLIN